MPNSKIFLSYCLQLSFWFIFLQACEEPNKKVSISDASSYLSEIKTTIPTHTVLRENLLEEQGVSGIDSIRFSGLQLNMIEPFDPTITYSVLGKIEETFSKHPCILFLKDAPQHSKVWIIVYKDGKELSDFQLVMDLEHPGNLKLSGYLRKDLLEINQTGENQSLYSINSAGAFERPE